MPARLATAPLAVAGPATVGRAVVVFAVALLVSSCGGPDEAAPTGVTGSATTVAATTSPDPDEPGSAEPAVSDPSLPETSPSTDPPSDLPVRPDWLGTRDLTPTDPALGPVATGLSTPPELRDRRFATIDRLPPPPPGADFAATIEPVPTAILAESTWHEGCPVGSDELAYLTVAFWGFDDRQHTGDLIVNASVADDIVSVFERLWAARYPIEEIRVTTAADLAAAPTGDGNVTAGFVCRATRGSSTWSEHAKGLAVDVNPFLNPYRRGDVVLPELAAHYLDRSLGAPGQIRPGDVVTEAFAAIGWEWGGDWSTLVDYQHFALENR